MGHGMKTDPLARLSDVASEAHRHIQQAHQHINPVMGLRRGMRDNGIPADAMTIDCLRTRRRIVLVLHDQRPGQLIYQFTGMDEDNDAPMQQVPLEQLSCERLCDWMADYFGADTGN